MEERFIKASELLQQESFLVELKKAETDEEVKKLFESNGVALSLDDIDLMCKESIELNNKNDSEIGEDELDNVAGGVIISTVACFALAGCSLGFYTSYGYRKLIKRG